MASEKGEAQTNESVGVVGPQKVEKETSRRQWEVPPKKVKALYTKVEKEASGILSTTRHEKSSRKQPGPSGKAKYYLVTDSEPVP